MKVIIVITCSLLFLAMFIIAGILAKRTEEIMDEEEQKTKGSL